tara:strand:- start:558 stop:779 length:222 start_codon:yes stop_codon:yes gene_type:complete
MVLYIVEPLISISNKDKNIFLNRDREKEKLIIMKQIKVLELDYDIGNISFDDFELERKILKTKVSGLIDEIKG